MPRDPQLSCELASVVRKTSRRVLVCVALAGLWSSAMASYSHGQAKSPPNIVFIISDDHGANDYGFFGYRHLKTPNLDKLASQSLVYRNGMVTSSLCCPSLASMLTGLYPHQNKITSNDPPAKAKGREWYSQQMQKLTTLTRLLQRLGYLSLQTGKWWHGDFSTGGFTHGMTKKGRHGDDGLDIGRKTMAPIFEFIQEAKQQQKPFFVWYAPMLPHTPHNPPERWLAQFKDKCPSLATAKYWANIAWFDETCGQLLDHLDQQGLRDNTIVVYLADNGWEQDPITGAVARSKRTQYDLGHRTPILIRWPGRAAPGMSATRVSSIDLAPTILKAVGLPVPQEMTGVDLLDPKAVAARKYVFGETFSHDAVDLEDPASSLQYRWVTDGPWRLIVGVGKNAGSVELYQVENDPRELKDLAAQEPQRVREMAAALDAWWPGISAK